MPRMNRTVSRNLNCGRSAILTLFLFAPAVQAGELSQVPDGPRHELGLKDAQGHQRSLDEFRGEVVLINFWASWCTPCVQEMPSLLRLQKSLRGYPFRVVGINVAEGERRAQAAAARLGLDFPVLLDPDSRVFKAWGGEVLPTTYILDGSGKARYVAQGPLDWDRVDIQHMLEDLMQERVDRPGAGRGQ